MKKPRWINWIIRHPIKTILLLATIGAIGFLSSIFVWAYYAFAPNPYCDVWKKRGSKEEKIKDFLTITNDQDRSYFIFGARNNNLTHRFVGKQVPYKSADEILKRYPDCCKLYSETSYNTDHPTEILPESDDGVVVVHYPALTEILEISPQKYVYRVWNYNDCLHLQ